MSDPSLLGDDICHNFGLYNTTAGCGFDGGDCDKFNANYTRDGVNNYTAPYPFFLGDGKSDGGDVYNSPECNYDGGDCFDVNLKYPNCTVDFPVLLDNGRCDVDKAGYNTTECGYDGTDCMDFWAKYTDCDVRDRSRIGDYLCDGEPYNTEECGFDGELIVVFRL